MRVDLDLRGIAAFTVQRVSQEAAHLLVAHPRQHGGAQAQSRHAKCDVGGTAA